MALAILTALTNAAAATTAIAQCASIAIAVGRRPAKLAPNLCC